MSDNRNHSKRASSRPHEGKRQGTPDSKVSPARLFALRVGKVVRERKAFTHDVIASQIDKAGLSAEDKAFATKLALGVTMSSGTLDELIDRHVNNPASLSPEVRDALRVSVYEIIFLDKSAHAAVDQGVELVRSVQPRAAGLANAVLRRVAAAKEHFPFANPDISLQALARKNAFPLWLAKSVLDDRGLESLKSFMEASNEVAPLYVSVNCLKAAESDVLAVLEDAGAQPSPVDLGGTIARCWRLDNHRVIGDDRVRALFECGALIVSDASAQAIARLAVPSKMPERFLEVGAGRGTKSILLQNVAKELFGSQMPLESLDSHKFKTDLVLRRAKATGVRVDAVHTLDARTMHAKFGDDAFDAIFVDAPCSGLGTLRRHPEIRWRITPKDISKLAQLNVSILDEAAKCLKVGGQLTYATCTVSKKENEWVVERFLKGSNGEKFKVLAMPDGSPFFASNLVSGGPDAHFAVRFVRVR